MKKTKTSYTSGNPRRESSLKRLDFKRVMRAARKMLGGELGPEPAADFLSLKVNDITDKFFLPQMVDNIFRPNILHAQAE